MSKKKTGPSNSINDDIYSLKRTNNLNTLKIGDIYSLNLLQPLLIGHPILPFTGSALRPFCLIHLINDIIINERKQIIEFGTGISTIVMARLITKNNLNATIFSIEHNTNWKKIIRQKLEAEGLNSIVQLIDAPLKASELSPNENEWYNTEVLDAALSDKTFDMVIVDGPPAWEPHKQLARYPALPFTFNKLQSNCSIYLDDANRPGEQQVLQRWEKQFSVKFRITGETLAYCHRGESFFTEPFVYY